MEKAIAACTETAVNRKLGSMAFDGQPVVR